jgi:hypothetical protein
MKKRPLQEEKIADNIVYETTGLLLFRKQMNREYIITSFFYNHIPETGDSYNDS